MKTARLFLAILLLIATRMSAADLDEMRARPATDYVKQSVIYQIQMRPFTPEGTLKAATGRLPKLAELGVDILYLTPIFVSDDDPDQQGWSPHQRASGIGNPRNPYRMKDYYNVDPEYGTNDDLKEFVATAHGLKMRVMLDMVFLHCGPNAIFLKDNPDFVERDEDGEIVCEAWGFPKINHQNPKLREYLLKNMEYWVRDFDVDGFRADVSHRVPMPFWNEARQRLEKLRPDIIMLAEGSGGHQNQLEAFDIDYHFPWLGALHRVCEGRASASEMRSTWETAQKIYLPGSRFIHYLESHDTTTKYHDGKRPNKIWGPEVVDTALVLNFTIDGVPFLYNGQEVADTARHSIYSLPGQMHIDWSNAETPQGKARFGLCQKLCTLRHSERALAHGTVTWLDNSAPDEVISFLRTSDDEEVLTVINMRKKDVTVTVDLPSADELYRPLLTRGVKTIADAENKKTFALQGCGFFAGKRQ